VENKKNNFKRISENRVSKIIVLIRQLTNLTNTSFYEYTNEQIEKMFDEINEELNKSKKVLLKNNAKRTKKIEL